RSAVSISDTMDWLMSMSSQPDGKILVAGLWYDGKYERTAIIRFHANGIPDSSFGVNGIVKIENTNKTDQINMVKMDSAWRIVAAGASYDGTKSVNTMYRLFGNGTRDTSFGVNGLASFDVGTQGDGTEALAIQSDGKYILAGHSYRNDTANYDFSILRVLAGGELDVNDNTGTYITSDLSAYPNPLTDKITIRTTLESDSYCTLKLYGERGELVRMFFHDEFQTEGVFEESISLRDIPEGVYFLTFDEGRSTRSVKVIKE
ncbi:MAG TPA: T9SS type A sorting domain-containing protein, partial [Candidatus Kapabacteria bacterium]